MPSPIDHRAGNALVAKIAVAILVFSVGAFALKVIVHPERAARYTPLVMVHGATMVAWFSMMASQAYLAANNRLNPHRALGRWSPLLVIAMVGSGMTVSWNLSQEFDRYDVLVGNTGIFATFIPLYIAAILFARGHDQASHRQAMLIGSLAMLGPAYSRVMDILEQSTMLVLPVQLVVTIGSSLWLDRVSRGHVAKSTWWMLGFYLAILGVTIAAFFTVLPQQQ